jgi:hypothetical protein
MNPNTAIHAYARMITLDDNTHKGMGFTMSVSDSKGKVLWTGNNEGKRDMSVIFILDPYEDCVTAGDLERGEMNYGSWFGLPGGRSISAIMNANENSALNQIAALGL